MTTQEISERMAALEKQWFAEHAAAAAAHRQMLRAQKDHQTGILEAVGAELRRAEASKTAIIAQIESLEDSLLE